MSNGSFLAGPAGIEPAPAVLETAVLPLYEGPMNRLYSETFSILAKND